MHGTIFSVAIARAYDFYRMVVDRKESNGVATP